MTDTNLKAEMLEAFLGIGEIADAHVQAQRHHVVGSAEQVAASIDARRRMYGATGITHGVEHVTPARIENRLVPDPTMTDAEYYHQRAANPTKPNIGKVWARENAITRIGALCFIRRRSQHHEKAAEMFKGFYEARYGCGVPAMDASREPVDRSPIAHDSGMAAKLDRTWKLEQALEYLGKPAFDRLVALLVLCVPAGEGVHWRIRKTSVEQALTDLDDLAVVWRLRARNAA